MKGKKEHTDLFTKGGTTVIDFQFMVPYNMPKYSIIIRCYNEAEHIDRLLTGIYRQSIVNSSNTEVIVVDSGSTDDTVSIASQYPVKLVPIRKQDFSFGRALNLGCKAASGEYLIIVSAHVYPVHRDWLAHLVQPFSDSQVALAYGKQRGNDVTKYAEHQIFAKWFPEESDFDQSHPFCNNANAVIRRNLWQQIPYNEILTGLEDLDWSKQAKQLGYRIAYVAEAEVIHVHDEPSKRVLNRYRREAIALKQIFPAERFNAWDFTRLLIGNIASDFYHAICDGVFLKNYFEIMLFRLMQFWGTYRGFTHHGWITNQLKQTFYYPKGLSRPKSERHTLRQPIDYAKIALEKSHQPQESIAAYNSLPDLVYRD